MTAMDDRRRESGIDGIEAAANLIAGRLADAPPAVVESNPRRPLDVPHGRQRHGLDLAELWLSTDLYRLTVQPDPYPDAPEDSTRPRVAQCLPCEHKRHASCTGACQCPHDYALDRAQLLAAASDGAEAQMSATQPADRPGGASDADRSGAPPAPIRAGGES